ncbi:MAG: hypothetical protein U5L09_19105 [Bacteroidales bacterium]|nr:hypothetical protein [Bacteroidales bacterium]
MKFRRVYLIDRIPSDEFYEKNATDIDHLENGEYWLISSERDGEDTSESSDKQDDSFPDDTSDKLPF